MLKTPIAKFQLFSEMLCSASNPLGHFEWASTNNINIFPFIGPAKSTCTLCHDLPGQTHGCRGARGSVI